MKNEKLVMQNIFLEEKTIPKSLRKEILTLCKLGLEEYEIRYLLTIKQKEIESLKWEE